MVDGFFPEHVHLVTTASGVFHPVIEIEEVVSTYRAGSGKSDGS